MDEKVIDFSGMQRYAKNYACRTINDMSEDELKSQCVSLGKLLSDYINRLNLIEIGIDRLIYNLISTPNESNNPAVKDIIRRLEELKRKPKPDKAS